MLELIPPPARERTEPLAEPRMEPRADSESETIAIATARVRLLTEPEIQTLAPIFAEQGATLPDPATSFFVGTVDEDSDEISVTSFLVVQLRVHAEPMWIKPGHESVFRSLVHSAEQIIQERTGGGCDVFLFAPAGKIARMAEVAGMRTEPWVVYSKRIESMTPQPEPEPQPQAQHDTRDERKKRIPVWQRESTEVQ